MAKVRVLSGTDVRQLIALDVAINLVEQGFAEYYRGNVDIFPVVREDISDHSGLFGVKSGYMRSEQILGLKAGGFWAPNITHGILNHQSTMLLFNPATGQPVCLLEANYLTGIRTGASGAVAAKHLAPSGDIQLGIIGAGTQGRMQLRALSLVRNVKEVWVFDERPASAESLVGEFRAAGVDARATRDAQSLVEQVNVLVTTTPSYDPVLRAEWVKPGTHINAMGSDTRGKQELDETLLPTAKLVVDDLDQCKVLGETQHAFKRGLMDENDVYASLGEIAAGVKPGRTTDDEITVFDGTGVSLQDLITAGYAFAEAERRGAGQVVEL